LENRRLTLDISGDLESILEKLGDTTRQSKADVIRSALSIMMHLTGDPRQGPRNVLNEAFEREIFREERESLGKRLVGLQSLDIVSVSKLDTVKHPDTRKMGRRVFISYAREDNRKASHLYRKLQHRGHHPWMDHHQLKKGADWQVAVKKAISDAEFFVAILSKQSVRKVGFVQVEVHNAAQEQLKRPDGIIYFIPFKIDECELPEFAKKFNYIDATRESFPYKALFDTIESV
jgi:hypothetical protein